MMLVIFIFAGIRQNGKRNMLQTFQQQNFAGCARLLQVQEQTVTFAGSASICNRFEAVSYLRHGWHAIVRDDEFALRTAYCVEDIMDLLYQTVFIADVLHGKSIELDDELPLLRYASWRPVSSLPYHQRDSISWI